MVLDVGGSSFRIFSFVFRSSRPEVFYKKGVLTNFAKFTGKHLCQSLFFYLIKKRLWHRCFPVNFAKFLRTLFLKEHLRWLLLRLAHLIPSTVEYFAIRFRTITLKRYLLAQTKLESLRFNTKIHNWCHSWGFSTCSAYFITSSQNITFQQSWTLLPLHQVVT